MRLYAVNSIGRPGKLLLDLGTFGTNPLNATGNVSTNLHATGLYCPPGLYIGNLFATFTGGSTPPALAGAAFSPTTGLFGMSAGLLPPCTIASGGSGTASDPANTTSYAYTAIITYVPLVGLHNA
jgi:hypothetical protein